jgi:RNA polymerase sigma-70 factor (ECF subfamily)
VGKAHRSHLGSQRRSVAREARPAGATGDPSDALAQALVADDTSPSNRLARQEQLDRVRAALETLSPRDREVLTLRYFDQRSPAEIAEGLGLTEAGVKSRLLRALLRVRTVLDVETEA